MKMAAAQELDQECRELSPRVVFLSDMGCSAGAPIQDKVKLEELQNMQARFPLRRPALPGDILLSGNLPSDVVGQLASHCRGWLYLNETADEHYFPAPIQAAGCELEVVPFKPSKDLPASVVEQVASCIARMPRPLMIQCTSANRAAIAMLAWMAKMHGCTPGCIDLLVADLQIDTVRPEAKAWLQSRLPSLGERDGPLIQHSPEVRQFFDPVSSTLTYLIACPATKQAVLIDPVLEHKGRDLKAIRELGLNLKYVLNTHCHADHVTSGGVIRKDSPQVQTIISKNSGAQADIHVQHGDKVAFGDLSLEVRATPGHTDGCVTYVLKTQTATFAFTGDTLLIRGCGRTDFQQGNSLTLHDSVHAQVFTLPDDALVCPGHDYKDRGVSTVLQEKMFNPRLTKSPEDFAKFMEDLNLPNPKQIDIAVPANMACGVQFDPSENLPI